ncbi:hypothetical protein CAT32_11330 [Acinetobacter baumannii]|nr:hypothetical protein B9X43_17040 [Acinetobacter baumannii]OTU66593.1 hypothetical protein CAT32_11330 [Acinetobacter baumannii]
MNNQKIVIDYLDKNNELSKELIWGEIYRTDQYFIRRANSNMRCDSLKSLMIINKLSKFL